MPPIENTDAGVDAAVAADAARYEEAFAAEEARANPSDAGDDVGSDEGAVDSSGKPADGAQAKTQEPLPLEEIQKRLSDRKIALQQERQQRRAAEQRAAQLEQQLQLRQAPNVSQRPDPDTDPMGYLKYVESRLEATDNQAAQNQQHQAQLQAQQRAVNEVVTRASEAEQDFADVQPDYYDAVAHLKSARAQEYQALGLSPAEAAQRVDAEAIQTAHEMLSRGQDPARGWYELAKARGYTPGQAAQGANGDGQAKPSKLDTIRAGQAAAASLGSAGGRGGSGEVSASSVANLKGAAFDQAFEKLRAAARATERRTGF